METVIKNGEAAMSEADLVLEYEITYEDDSDSVSINVGGGIYGRYKPFASGGIAMAIGLSLRNALTDGVENKLISQDVMDMLAELAADRFRAAICGQRNDLPIGASAKDEAKGKQQ